MIFFWWECYLNLKLLNFKNENLLSVLLLRFWDCKNHFEPEKNIDSRPNKESKTLPPLMRGRLDSFQFLTLAGYMNFFIVKPFKCGRCDELFKSGDGVESLMDYKRKQRQQLLHITPEEKIGTAVLILIWARRILTEILSSNWKKSQQSNNKKILIHPPPPPCQIHLPTKPPPHLNLCLFHLEEKYFHSVQWEYIYL